MKERLQKWKDSQTKVRILFSVGTKESSSDGIILDFDELGITVNACGFMKVFPWNAIISIID